MKQFIRFEEKEVLQRPLSVGDVIGMNGYYTVKKISKSSDGEAIIIRGESPDSELLLIGSLAHDQITGHPMYTVTYNHPTHDIAQVKRVSRLYPEYKGIVFDMVRVSGGRYVFDPYVKDKSIQRFEIPVKVGDVLRSTRHTLTVESVFPDGSLSVKVEGYHNKYRTINPYDTSAVESLIDVSTRDVTPSNEGDCCYEL